MDEKFGGAAQQQISGPTALGTRLLSPKTSSSGSRWVSPHPYPPPLVAPKPAHRAPIFRSIDQDIPPVPPVPMILNVNTSQTVITGQPLATNIQPPAPAATRSLNNRQESPNEDFIPIMHNPFLDRVAPHPLSPAITSNIRTAVIAARAAPQTIVIPPTPSDDGFTPVTPTPISPILKRFQLTSRAPPLVQQPRDALGIPIGKKFLRSKSQGARARRAEEENQKIQKEREREERGGVEDGDGGDDNDDTTPLSPTGARDLLAKPARKTLWGAMIEGWWDLGLLERGKSLRRRGGR